MRSLTLLLAGALAVSVAATAVKDAMYQIQGVEIDDAIVFEDADPTRHAAHARRKRQTAAIEPETETLHKSESRRQAGYDALSNAAATRPRKLQQKQQQRPLQVPSAAAAASVLAAAHSDAHVRPLRHFTNPGPPPPQSPALFRPATGFAAPANSLQQQAALAALLQQQQQLQQQAQLLQQLQQQPLQQPPIFAPQLPRPAPPQFNAPPRTAVRTKKGTNYYYPPRQPLPLPKCFHNPTGYVCCNEELNDLMVDTYTVLEQRPKFHACNIQLIATHLQLNAQRRFNTSFETLVGYEDFAQKINFRGDMVCKVELGSRYMIAYATASDAYNHDLGGQRREKRETNGEFEWSSGAADSWSSIHSSFL